LDGLAQGTRAFVTDYCLAPWLLFFVGLASSGIRAYLLLTLVVGTTAACKQNHLFSVWTQLTVGTFFPLLLILLLMRLSAFGRCLNTWARSYERQITGDDGPRKEELYGVMAEGGTVWGDSGRRNCLRGWRTEELFGVMAKGRTV
jgi:hypothetical protein